MWPAIIGAGASIIGGILNSNAAGDAASAQKDAANNSNALQKYMYDTSRADMSPWRDYGLTALDRMNGMGGGRGELQRKYDEAIKNRDHLVSVIDSAQGQNMDPRWGPGAQTYNAQAEDYKRQLDALGPGLSGAALGQSIMSEDPGYQFRLDQGNKAINAAASARGRSMGGAAMKELSRYGQDYASNEYGNAYNRLAAQAGVGQSATNNMANLGQQYAQQYGQNQAAIGNANAAGSIGQANAIGGALQNVANGYMMYDLFSPPKAAGKVSTQVLPSFNQATGRYE